MVGGPAGYGINASGEMFSRCFTRGGLNVLAYLEYPSLIRGGHNSYHIRVCEGLAHSPMEEIGLLVCLNRETFDLHKDNVPAGGGVLYDSEDFQIEEGECPEGVGLYAVPFMKIVKENNGIDIMRNTVALGASLGLLKYPFEYLEKLISEQFAKKGEKVVGANVTVAKAGYEYVSKNYDVKTFEFTMEPTGEKPRILLSGNDAFSYGAMQAGCKYFCSYPMTPASDTLTTFARHEEEMGIVVKQPEDELAAILNVIGAGFTGVRAMAATSGGGFALMNEALSMAGMVEVPIVIMEAQRPGPATGLPTWTGQGDLQFLIHSGHDEFPRLVIAPGDVTEAFELTQHAFNYAERYHMPVLLVSDKLLSESLFSVPDFDEVKVEIDRGPVATEDELKKREGVKEDYPRYQDTKTGVSPRSLPGMKNARYVANSNEHDEFGDIDETPEVRKWIHAKRLRKLEKLAAELPAPKVYGPEDADISLIAWGSTKGPALEAIRLLEEEGVKVNFIHPVFLHPFPKDTMTDFLKKAKKTLLIEGNHDAQLGQLIREHTLMDVDEKLLKWDGRPFYPREIVEKVKSLTS